MVITVHGIQLGETLRIWWKIADDFLGAGEWLWCSLDHGVEHPEVCDQSHGVRVGLRYEESQAAPSGWFVWRDFLDDVLFEQIVDHLLGLFFVVDWGCLGHVNVNWAAHGIFLDGDLHLSPLDCPALELVAKDVAVLVQHLLFQSFAIFAFNRSSRRLCCIAREREGLGEDAKVLAVLPSHQH